MPVKILLKCQCYNVCNASKNAAQMPVLQCWECYYYTKILFFYQPSFDFNDKIANSNGTIVAKRISSIELFIGSSTTTLP